MVLYRRMGVGDGRGCVYRIESTMSEIPSIHDQYEEIMGFVDDKCREEEKHYHMTHALTANEPAPACEMLTVPAKFQAWEDPGVISPEQRTPPFGKLAFDYKGEVMDNANACPYCDCFIWIHKSTPVGSTLECWKCHSNFRRTA